MHLPGGKMRLRKKRGTNSTKVQKGILCCCCLVVKSCLTLREPTHCSTPGFFVLHHLQEFAQIHGHWVDDAIQPSHPLSPPSLLPSIFPSIRIFSNESALHIRWPKYWSFSLSISPSKEYSRLTPFTIDWFELFTMTCLPWEALHSMAHINSIIELCKTFCHHKAKIYEGVDVLATGKFMKEVLFIGAQLPLYTSGCTNEGMACPTCFT